MNGELAMPDRKRCGRCDVAYLIGEPTTTYVNRYSCHSCGISFWEQKGCGNVTLGVSELNAVRLPQAHTGKKKGAQA